MSSDELIGDLLRYSRQIVLKAMDHVRARMRGSMRLSLSQKVDAMDREKADDNPTKGVDREAEELMVAALCKKLLRRKSLLTQFTVVSEELGVSTFPQGANENDSDYFFFIDPIDGTEFIEALQGGWTLLTIVHRPSGEAVAAVAGDIFLNRVYWAAEGLPPEGLDFSTHSWFRLDGGPAPKIGLENARINVLTTKVSRFRAVAQQRRLLDALDAANGRLNLAWGSNTIIQVAAGYADASVEFAKGFAAYDILAAFYIGRRAGLTILDPQTKKIIPSAVDCGALLAAFRKDPTNLPRQRFVAAATPELARTITGLLDL